ncbi:MAG TPA: DinB family protein [Gemmatimonadaceae bacterium]|nr:DinB family protein [Gemmatimonadaceae bacterium]
MRIRAFTVTFAVALLPRLAVAQLPAHPVAADQPANPVATAFRSNAAQMAKNLTAAADEMPADKYGFKPTPAQMSFGDIVVHLAQGNDYLCGSIGGAKAPARTKIAATDSKAALVARLRETFQFCDQALASLDDSKLGEALPFFGGRTMSRAGVMMVTVGDWADHYSQSAIYLRLNGLLPPTAKKAPAAAQ